MKKGGFEQLDKILPATLTLEGCVSEWRLDNIASLLCDPAHIRCERTQYGQLRLHPPHRASIRLMAEKIHTDLERWVKEMNTHGRVMRHTRFFLKEELMLCPDLAYVHAESEEDAAAIIDVNILRTPPSFVVEICTAPKELRPLKEKMFHWIALGIQLGWLIVPQEKCVYIYAPGEDPVIADGDLIVADAPLENFFILLDTIWSFEALRSQL